MKRLGSRHVQYCIKELNIQPDMGRIMQQTRPSLQLSEIFLKAFLTETYSILCIKHILRKNAASRLNVHLFCLFIFISMVLFSSEHEGIKLVALSLCNRDAHPPKNISAYLCQVWL